jgi:hypothetical protein
MKTKRKFKTLLLTMCAPLFFVSNPLWSQSDTNKRPGQHEIKLNGLHILLESIEISYDFVIGEQSTVGASFAASSQGNLGYDYMLVPNYKLFFNEKKAAGFFIELNSAVVSDVDDLNFGMGIAIGGKFLNKKNFIGEIILGGGRTFNNNGAYGRFGISIGKRF